MSRRAYANEFYPELLLPVSLSPEWATATPASAGDPLILAGRSGPVTYMVTTFFSYILVHTRTLVHPPRVEFVSTSPVEFLDQIPVALRVRSSGGFSQCQTIRLGSLMLGSEISLLWKNFCTIIFSNLWVAYPAGMGFDFIVIAPSYHLLVTSLSLDVGYLFFFFFDRL